MDELKNNYLNKINILVIDICNELNRLCYDSTQKELTNNLKNAIRNKLEKTEQLYNSSDIDFYKDSVVFKEVFESYFVSVLKYLRENIKFFADYYSMTDKTNKDNIKYYHLNTESIKSKIEEIEKFDLRSSITIQEIFLMNVSKQVEAATEDENKINTGHDISEFWNELKKELDSIKIHVDKEIGNMIKLFGNTMDAAIYTPETTGVKASYKLYKELEHNARNEHIGKYNMAKAKFNEFISYIKKGISEISELSYVDALFNKTLEFGDIYHKNDLLFYNNSKLNYVFFKYYSALIDYYFDNIKLYTDHYKLNKAKELLGNTKSIDTLNKKIYEGYEQINKFDIYSINDIEKLFTIYINNYSEDEHFVFTFSNKNHNKLKSDWQILKNELEGIGVKIPVETDKKINELISAKYDEINAKTLKYTKN